MRVVAAAVVVGGEGAMTMTAPATTLTILTASLMTLQRLASIVALAPLTCGEQRMKLTLRTHDQ